MSISHLAEKVNCFAKKSRNVRQYAQEKLDVTDEDTAGRERIQAKEKDCYEEVSEIIVA